MHTFESLRLVGVRVSTLGLQVRDPGSNPLLVLPCFYLTTSALQRTEPASKKIAISIHRISLAPILVVECHFVLFNILMQHSRKGDRTIYPMPLYPMPLYPMHFDIFVH